MTAGAGTRQSSRSHRPGRIIERPRLIKQLDAAEAPVILIVAPAGYGKTTLARQWAKTLNGVIWVSCTPAHRDVVTFAEDVAAGIDALGGNASTFIGEYVRARSNPQRASHEIARALVRRLSDTPAQWLVIDDYQELAEAPEIEEVVATLTGGQARVLVASRIRPKWATNRAAIYGDLAEVDQTQLVMTQAEVVQVVGARPDLEPLLDHAKGWPAVVSLLARLHEGEARSTAPTTIHAYVADELFRYADPDLQRHLLRLALLPNLERPVISGALQGDVADAVLETATELGFIADLETPEIHPLVREFLLAKLAKDPAFDTEIERAVHFALAMGAWEFALELVLRFDLRPLLDPVLEQVFNPLMRSGKLRTLTFARDRVRGTGSLPPSAIDLVDAEIAMRDGQFVLAADLARRASAALPGTHGLQSRAHQIVGRAGFFLSSFSESERAYTVARKRASESADEAESLFGLASVQIFGEHGDPWPAVSELESNRYRSTTELLRYATTLINVRRFTTLSEPLPIEEALLALRDANDPQARTSFTYTASYLFAQRADYRRAEEMLALLLADVSDFDLDFIQPFADWVTAAIHMGTRRFGSADRHLQRVEDMSASSPSQHHGVNARMLRARLLLEVGRPSAALEVLHDEPNAAIYPSWRGEFRATRALALACDGRVDDALAHADLASKTSRFVEVGVLAQAARAVAGSLSRSNKPVRQLFLDAERTGVWDSVLCGLRASQSLLALAADDDATRPKLSALLARCDDHATARRAGMRPRATRRASEILTPREVEVLGLVAQGMRNKEIATALYVEESTIKVHVRHILEKLGVRTRAEAVARFERGALSSRTLSSPQRHQPPET